MASKVFEIKEETPYKELTLYPAQGEDRPLIVFNTVLKTVQENTEAILQHYQELGVDVRWELNPGNHFRDVAMRSAKGIKAILEA
ncbi:MAG: hypothetical protein ACLTF6_06325 [Clostridium sp.]